MLFFDLSYMEFILWLRPCLTVHERKSNRQLRTGECLKHERHSEILRLMLALGREASESILCPVYLGSLETTLKGSPRKSKVKLEGLEHYWEMYLEASVTKMWPAPWIFYYPSYTSIQSGSHVFRLGVILDFSFWQFHFKKKKWPHSLLEHPEKGFIDNLSSCLLGIKCLSWVRDLI